MAAMNEGVYDGPRFATELNTAVISVAPSGVTTTYNMAKNTLLESTLCRVCISMAVWVPQDVGYSGYSRIQLLLLLYNIYLGWE